MGCRIIGLQRERLFEQRHRLAGLLWHRNRDVRKSPQQKIVSIEIVRPLAFNSCNFSIAQTWLYCSYDAQRDFVLKCENISKPAIVTFSPQVDSSFRLDQLNADSNALIGLANASFQDIADAQFAANTFHVNGFPFVCEA